MKNPSVLPWASWHCEAVTPPTTGGGVQMSRIQNQEIQQKDSAVLFLCWWGFFLMECHDRLLQVALKPSGDQFTVLR